MALFKIFRAREWADFEAAGRFAGSADDLRDGFIHLSTGEQLDGTLGRHFAGEAGLHLLALDSAQLPDLRWEPSRGGQLFPHLYRELRTDDILWSRPLPLGPDGHITGDLA